MPRRKNSFSSNLTLSILLLLRNSQLTTYMLSQILSIPSRKISRYLCMLKKNNIVNQDEDGYWFLTREGLKVVNEISFLNNFKYLIKEKDLNKIPSHLLFNQAIKLKTTKTLQKDYGKTTLRLQKGYKNTMKDIFIVDDINEYKILAKIRERLGRELTRAEEEVLRFIISHTIKIGRKYWWPSTPGVSLAEALWDNMSSNSISIDEISQALRELEAKAIIYIRFDERRNVPKIRIDRSIID